MTVMTKEQIEALLNNDPGVLGQIARDALNTALALHQQLADAKPAQAMVVERAEEVARIRAEQHANMALNGLPGNARLREAMEAAFTDMRWAIRALADTDGLALVQALRAERDRYLRHLTAGAESINSYKADRDRLATANAALEAQVARLVGAVKEYHLALDRRQNGNTAGYRLQDEIQRILDMPWRQGAALAEVQADARREGGE